jgi:anti-sigma B factor antagonist
VIARIDEEWHGEVPVASLQGELDASNVGELGARLRTLLNNHLIAMVVDLSGTTYLDSAGINLLFSFGAELNARQQSLVLVVRSGSPIERMIQLTGLGETVAVHPTVPAALTSLEVA